MADNLRKNTYCSECGTEFERTKASSAEFPICPACSESVRTGEPEWELDYGTSNHECCDWLSLLDIHESDDLEPLAPRAPKPKEAQQVLDRLRLEIQLQESEVLHGYERMRQTVHAICRKESQGDAATADRNDWIEARFQTFQSEKSLQRLVREIVSVRPSDRLTSAISDRQRRRAVEVIKLQDLSNEEILERELQSIQPVIEQEIVQLPIVGEPPKSVGILGWVGGGILISLLGYAVIGAIVVVYMLLSGFRPPEEYMRLSMIAFSVWFVEVVVIVVLYASLMQDDVTVGNTTRSTSRDDAAMRLQELNVLSDMASGDRESAARNMQIYQNMKILRQLRDKE